MELVSRNFFQNFILPAVDLSGTDFFVPRILYLSPLGQALDSVLYAEPSHTASGHGQSQNLPARQMILSKIPFRFLRWCVVIQTISQTLRHTRRFTRAGSGTAVGGGVGGGEGTPPASLLGA